MISRNSNLKRVELVPLVVGLALIGVALSIDVAGRISSRGALARFHSASPSQMANARAGPKSAAEVNHALWSSKRVEHYKASLAQHFDEPLAVLRVDKIHLEAPVFEGTSERVLNRGVGRP
jgi:sortase A